MYTSYYNQGIGNNPYDTFIARRGNGKGVLEQEEINIPTINTDVDQTDQQREIVSLFDVVFNI